jgi:hypothetical protein
MKHPQEFGQVHSKTTYHDRPGVVNRPVFPVYRVGEIFHRNCRQWPEGAQFIVRPGGPELTLFQTEIRPGLVDEVRRGPAEFALIVEPPVIVLAYRFGESIPWSDVPYSWHLQPEQGRAIPTLVNSPEARALLWITLVGTSDGIIHAQRGMTLSPSFTRALHQSIRDQAISAFDPEECTLAISSIYLRSFSTVDRLRIAAARTMGNE